MRKHLKANRHKGTGRPGAAYHSYTIVLSKAASKCGEKTMRGGLVHNNYSIYQHNAIMQVVYQGKYNGSDMHYRKQAAYYANR